MSVGEVNMWLAYFNLQNEERERQDRIAKMKR